MGKCILAQALLGKLVLALLGKVVLAVSVDTVVVFHIEGMAENLFFFLYFILKTFSLHEGQGKTKGHGKSLGQTFSGGQLIGSIVGIVEQIGGGGNVGGQVLIRVFS